MLTMTPRFATLREERARQTIDWLVGNFELKPLPCPAPASRAKRQSARQGEAADAEPAHDAAQD